MSRSVYISLFFFVKRRDFLKLFVASNDVQRIAVVSFSDGKQTHPKRSDARSCCVRSCKTCSTAPDTSRTNDDNTTILLLYVELIFQHKRIISSVRCRGSVVSINESTTSYIKKKKELLSYRRSNNAPDILSGPKSRTEAIFYPSNTQLIRVELSSTRERNTKSRRLVQC